MLSNNSQMDRLMKDFNKIFQPSGSQTKQEKPKNNLPEKEKEQLK